MFSKADTELLTRTNAGTAMGTLVRRFWIPSMLAKDIAEPNGKPARLRLVGEDFIVWRDGQGQLVVMDEACPHRGASMALGHPEGDGLRCIYHGWKFAADGTALDTPNCKSDSFRNRVKARIYPVREAGGLIWVYLGPKGKEPPFPHYRFFDAPVEELAIFHAKYDCNFVQFMEGTIDPAHPHVLHQDEDKLGKAYVKHAAPPAPGMENYTQGIDAESFVSDDLAPDLEVDDMAYGVQGVAFHEAVADGKPAIYARVHSWVLPFMAVPSPNSHVISVPGDDESTVFFAVAHMPGTTQAQRDEFVAQLAGPAAYYENGRFKMGGDEVWGQDRDARPGSFSAIQGVVPEDAACAISMGAIYDRSQEHLVPSDQLVVKVRRRMMAVAMELQEGKEPYHLSDEQATHLGAEMRLLKDTASWRDVMVPKSLGLRLAQQ